MWIWEKTEKVEWRERSGEREKEQQMLGGEWKHQKSERAERWRKSWFPKEQRGEGQWSKVENRKQEQEKGEVWREQWESAVRKTLYPGKEERGDGLEDKSEVRGEPMSCSDSALDDWLLSVYGCCPGKFYLSAQLPAAVEGGMSTSEGSAAQLLLQHQTTAPWQFKHPPPPLHQSLNLRTSSGWSAFSGLLFTFWVLERHCFCCSKSQTSISWCWELALSPQLHLLHHHFSLLSHCSLYPALLLTFLSTQHLQCY